MVSIGQKTKTKKQKKDREQREKENFVALGDLVRTRNKFFIEIQRLFFANRKKTGWND